MVSSRPPKVYKLPEPVDIMRDEVDALVERLGHDPAKVLRLRIHAREIQVDLPGPRRDIPKITVTHQILDGDQS